MTPTDKQIVQAAELYATMQNRLKGYDPAIRKAFIEGAVYALSHQWVSVEERLPDDKSLYWRTSPIQTPSYAMLPPTA